MKVRKSDIWVVTFPKSGTTWTQEMVWQIINKCDFEAGKQLLDIRFPHLELKTLGQGTNTLEQLDEAVDPRFIKTHLPLSFLPSNLLETAKVIYVARDPRDVMTSYFHHHRLIKSLDYIGDLPTFARRFIKNQVRTGPYFQHVEEAWTLKDNPNMLFLFYEEMKKDLKSVIRQVCDFLSCSLSEIEIEKLLDHLDIKNFRNNPAVNCEDQQKSNAFSKDGSFIRKGKVGGWREEIRNLPDLEKELDKWYKKQLKDTGILFPQ